MSKITQQRAAARVQQFIHRAEQTMEREVAAMAPLDYRSILEQSERAGRSRRRLARFLSRARVAIGVGLFPLSPLQVGGALAVLTLLLVGVLSVAMPNFLLRSPLAIIDRVLHLTASEITSQPLYDFELVLNQLDI